MVIQLKRIISLLCVFCIVAGSIFSLQVQANTEYPYTIEISNESPAKGNVTIIKLALKNYTEVSDKIRGIQIDITGVDPDYLEVVESRSLIEDSNTASNKVTYSEENQRIRLLYAKTDGVLADSSSELMEIQLKVKDDIKVDKEISMPVTMKIQTQNDRVTQNDSININCRAVDSIVSADVEWGSMEFTYEQGNWNPEKHEYENTGWKPENNDNYISITNHSEMDIKVTYQYTAKDGYDIIQGSFVDETGADTSEKVLRNEDNHRVNLLLEGVPDCIIENQTIGTVSVTIR